MGGADLTSAQKASVSKRLVNLIALSNGQQRKVTLRVGSHSKSKLRKFGSHFLNGQISIIEGYVGWHWLTGLPATSIGAKEVVPREMWITWRAEQEADTYSLPIEESRLRSLTLSIAALYQLPIDVHYRPLYCPTEVVVTRARSSTGHATISGIAVARKDELYNVELQEKNAYLVVNGAICA
jgi:hypothetical protein